MEVAKVPLQEYVAPIRRSLCSGVNRVKVSVCEIRGVSGCMSSSVYVCLFYLKYRETGQW